MRFWRPAASLVTTLVLMAGCKGEGGGGNTLDIPKVYPPVRAATPTALIANAKYAASAVVVARRALTPDGMPEPGDFDGGVMDGGMTMAMMDGGMVDAPPPPGLSMDGGGPPGGSGMPGSMDGGMDGGSTSPTPPGGTATLGMIVQQRLYTPGPTELLRVVQELDSRVGQLDPNPSKHPCLTGAPASKVYSFPGGVNFPVQLQCLDAFDGGYVAFGFGEALSAPDAGAQGSDGGPPDGGALAASEGGNDFYLVEGQAGGMGGAYHINRATGDVEGWIVVADSRAPSNSQVIMHLQTRKAAGTLELTLAGTGVGFCAAHLKTGGGHVFIDAKAMGTATTGAVMANGQYCDEARTGCFQASALGQDLGGTAAGCAGITRASFDIASDLDASAAAGANVIPATLSAFFATAPAGVPAF